MNPRACVLIPAFHNPRTVVDVVRAAAEHLPVVVVDDGSTDRTAELLATAGREIDGVTVLTHPRNLGKGRALRTGMEHAAAAGFTHAIAMDADGQHLAADLPALVAAAERGPTTLWIGHRDLERAGAGFGSRFGRGFSNFWTWVETGRWLPDTQSGFRCYPLAETLALHLTRDRYDFEIEVLVKAAWSGVALDSVPVAVRYFSAAERVSHLRLRDVVRISWLNTQLCTLRCCLPAPYLATRSLRRFHDQPLSRRVRESVVELLVREPGSAERIAGSVGLGLFFGIAPIWGFQIVTTIVVANLVNASKTVAVLASNISFPLLAPLILYASLVLGRLITGNAERVDHWAALQLRPADFWPWVAGSFLLAGMVAITGGLSTLLLVRIVRSVRRRGAAART
ncbi:MAG: DUF2062 domain-containing protein [Planctomycetes bacterium]|nr:DUF2062 domain-containing protein [Planctomycetota bacterium]